MSWLLEHIIVSVRDVREFCEDYCWQLLIAIAVFLALTYAMPLHAYSNAVPKIRIWLCGFGIMIVVLFILPDTWRRLKMSWTMAMLRMKVASLDEQIDKLSDEELLLIHTFTFYRYLVFNNVFPALKSLMSKRLVVFEYDEIEFAPKGKLMLKLADYNCGSYIKQLVHERFVGREKVDLFNRYPDVWLFEQDNEKVH